MKKKLKDKKITIFKYDKDPSAPGWSNEKVYIPIHPGTLWAYFRHLSGKEQFQAAATQVEENVVFLVNWRAELAEQRAPIDLYIRFKEAWYNITRIDTFEGYKSDLQLFCKLINKVDENKILPYE